ncbi:glutamate--tRNA ligase [Brucella sp. RRSP16]|uniref:Glutamate--tRNA ligase n=1 Tax=Brucella intermedia GD04153 TaxID=2975438 RepID=A0AA42GZI1_9HYPH|nr:MULTISPECIES: glutamate--tRNA ligase [Brucella]ERI16510.1 glutamyl-tRNA synthetase [Ochrobactrum sp. EGD-AQ16]KAB2697123.1 glutamate--tRNA ligase [Brucella intermedia]KAB2712364.1 glutamate--tRNA ligase [Brucella intermedia]MCH6205069.1 glutamate--tRNA ligase [Brucella ciceri]MDH0122938.1 glutamate--tRNA ligase [Brucella intermedia GD04153]
MTVTVRFAPSPTGYIHIGNTRTALSNWLFAQKNGGKFILRYDDTDVERSRDEYAQAIAVDLDWLGVKPDRVEYQSKRFDVYGRAVEKLKQAGLLYACYETADELERRRKLRLARRLPPVYGREGLKLTDEEKAAFQAEGRKPHWRFLLPNFDADPFNTKRTEVHWDDLVRGPQTVDLASMSDPVLVREDGTYLYTLPSVVDDIDLGITHIIRGDDHVTNTGVQIAIFEALGAKAPVFGHHNLLTTISGEGLSKRTGALSVGSLREAGFEPMAVASLAVLIGTSESVSASPNMESLAERFDLASISKSSAKFDPAELDTLNRALLHEMPFSEAKLRLAASGISGDKAEPFWLAVRGNLDRFKDVAHWWAIVDGELPETPDFSEEDRAFLGEAFTLLPPAPWDHQTWKIWADSVKAATGRKGKNLFMPLRLALTGQAHGPELADLLVLLGPERTLSRRP